MKLKTLLTILLIPFSLMAQSSDNEDRAYFSDFSSVKPALSYTTKQSGDTIDYVLLEIEVSNARPVYVFALKSNKAEQLIVNDSSKDMFLAYLPSLDYRKKIGDLLLANKKDEAVKEMRSDIYGLLTLMDGNDSIFIIHESILEYLELLLSTNRLNEFYSIFERLKLKNLRQEYSDLSMMLALALAEAGDFDRSFKVLSILNVEVNNPEAIPQLMEVLTVLRDAKKIPEVNRYYQRLQAISGNNYAIEAKMWSLYCDIQQGNVLTAKVLLESFKGIDKKLPEYSLYKFILGLIAKDAKKDLAALESFSEGIVYGRSIDDWMPELMYNTALSYYNTEKTDVATQILEEMRKFYPNNPYLALAEKDLK